ncbi:serine hydrolase [Streptomyces shenzhenensis]|uniref:serine-type D-Ala-D-Ala carboxypeptidase n=1 Tax=Streptomyces shenzhenensis TaxID=943815 RepID=A0A3M0I4S2_9ACTN|nr:serine hydrolase [Streptomyces shenzhenensis]RMB83200.1 D-alanyl-D-alanine carboxypeptidase [Streptomyces shenzhenensis]
MEEASVAGESPDRSKQRESSEEPTSGSAGAVPDTRDPRLAVARESASRGGVDTATKVLSTREASVDADETAAAGVPEGAENPTGARNTPEPKGEAGATSRAAARAAERATNPAGARNAPAAEGKAGAESRAAARNADGAENPAGAKNPTGAGNAPKAKGEAGAGSQVAVGTTDGIKNPTGAKNTPEAEGKAGAGNAPKAEAEAEDGSAAGAEITAEGGTGPGTDGTGTRLAAAVAAWVRSGDPDGSDDAEPAEAASKALPGASEPEPEGSAPEPNPTATSKAPSASGTGPRETDSKTDAGSKAEAGRETDADAKASAGTKADAAPASGTRTGTDTEARAAAAAGAGGAAAAGVTAGVEAEADSAGSPSGSGAKAGAEGAAGVDQPTAVFKAVRAPKGPQVDQPTTTLKVGGAKKPPAPAADAERTSKFVALKALDDPATRRPGPAPADATAAVPRLGPERTTQQPLPPKPPLDLLAELTNTPPPPQTPVRTLVRRIKIWTPLVVLLAIVFAIVQALRPLPDPALDLTADESYTFDGGEASIPWPSGGQGALDVQGIGSFGSSGAQKPVPIASVAKVMTAYLILRDHPLKGGEGPKIPVDQTAQDQATADGESTVEVQANDTITQREALEGVLIASANNVARLLARWDAGSEKAFVAKMNAAAKSLGMTHTTYTDPSGLEKTTVSTAADQVKLAKAAMQDASFREVARMMEYTDYKGAKHSNWNRLVGYNDVIGIKTGTTTAAGGNLVFAATREVDGETRTIVGAVLGQGPGGSDNTILSGALDAGDKLIRAAQGALKPAKILKKGDVVGYVDDGLGGRTPVVITKDVTAVGWAGLKVELSFAADDVPHTAKAGTKVGTLTVGDGSSGAVKVPVALQKELTEPGFTDKLTRLG